LRLFVGFHGNLSLQALQISRDGRSRERAYEQALDRARKRAPSILAAQDRINEARARLLGAKILLRENPLLELSAGPRYREGSDLIDAEIGISQSFELGGRRRARIAAAQADVDREAASSQNTARQLLRDVSTAFWQAVAAGEQVHLAHSADKVANESPASGCCRAGQRPGHRST